MSLTKSKFSRFFSFFYYSILSFYFSPNVDFCAYSIPHPSEAKMNVRIQTTGKNEPNSSQSARQLNKTIEKTNAIDALKTGLSDLHDLVAHVRDTYEAELAKKEYVEFEEVA